MFHVAAPGCGTELISTIVIAHLRYILIAFAESH